MRLRCGLIAVFALLIGVDWVLHHDAVARVQAAPADDSNVLWSLGKADGSADEFSLGASPGLVYEVGKSSPRSDWRERQDAAPSQPPVYAVRFSLDRVPAAPLLALDYLFLSDPPRALELQVNEKRGLFHIEPAPGSDLDERQANTAVYSRESLRLPVDPSYLRAGVNQIGISLLGESGSAYYDAVSLLRSGGDGPPVTATVKPTLLFRRAGDRLQEVTQVVLQHRLPLGKADMTLRVGSAEVAGTAENDGYDFGERVVEVDVPAVIAPIAYELKLTADGQASQFRGEFRPEKRWRIFAGLKIHNDIGYTDLQQNVEELDVRNTDGVLEIMNRFSFYKFNFEDGWLIDNYLRSRKLPRIRQLMSLAARNRVGISAFYLNLLTGLCTGEELYRSLYFSKRVGREYGVPIKSASLTDAPSHSWFTPSLLADAGITGFANGSNQTRAPLLEHSNLNEDSPFYWEGPDGERVMTWLARSYLQFNRLAGEQPTLERLRRTIPQFLARYRRSDYPLDAVMLYGLYTDNADIRTGEAQIIEAWNKAYAFPKLTPATDSDYYAYVTERFAAKLQTFRGDAGAYWEDGAASSAAETALNRDTQRLLPAAEQAAALATAFDPAQRYPAEEFREAWRNLLFYDEHTWGSARSVSQPERSMVSSQWEVKRSYALRANRLANDLLLHSLNRLTQNISLPVPALIVFNPEPWPRTDVIQIEVDANQQVTDLSLGRPAPVDVVDEKMGYRVLRLLVEKVPGMGYKAYGVRRTSTPAPRDTRPETNSWDVESPYYRIRFDPQTGAIAELYDKELHRDLVDASAPHRLNGLLYVSGGEGTRILQDLAISKPAQLEVTGQERAEILEKVRTPFGRRMRIRAQARHIPLIETEVSVYDHLKRVDLVNRLRKDEVRSKEAVYFAFPFRLSPPELAYQIQNAWVRPNVDQLPGACRDWFATQGAVVARDGGISIVWSSPDAPLITLTDINRGAWLKNLDMNNGHVFSYVINNYWFTNYRASQGGDFTFRYFLTSGPGFNDAELARFSAETRSPLVPYNRYDLGNAHLQTGERRMPAAEGSFLHIDGGHAELSAFKEAEDGNGYILRLRETAGQNGAVRLVFPAFPITAAYLTNGVEENLKPLTVSGNALHVPLAARKFSTMRLVLGSAELRTGNQAATARSTYPESKP